MKITLIGAGKLAWSLIPNLQQKGLEVLQLISSNPEKSELFALSYGLKNIVNNISLLEASTEVVILTVNDASIERVAALLPDDIPILHTSGSIEIGAIKQANAGVLYPLQIFTFDNITALDETPLFYEGKQQGLVIAQTLAETLSTTSCYVDSTQRLKIHAGAVFACNFSNVMYKIAARLLPEGTSFEVYKPLIENQIQKAFRFQPENTQTGPAVRHDLPTLIKHLHLLQSNPEWQTLYRLLSSEINPNLKGEI